MHLIEKIAEIHRQVSLRSLTAVGLGVPRCFFRFEPVSIAECSAFCAETTSLFKWGYVGLPPNVTPAGNFVPCTLSPLREKTQNETTQSKVIERFHFFDLER